MQQDSHLLDEERFLYNKLEKLEVEQEMQREGSHPVKLNLPRDLNGTCMN